MKTRQPALIQLGNVRVTKLQDKKLKKLAKKYKTTKQSVIRHVIDDYVDLEQRNENN